MDIQSFYSAIESDGDVALGRFMGNKNLLTKFLGKFLEDNNYRLLDEALKVNDYETALAASHTLKGVSGNLGLDPLYHYSSEIVNAIREKRYGDIAPAFDQLKIHYEKVMSLLRELGN